MSTAIEQPYPYRQRELVEPDWTRLAGWTDVTTAEWDDVQWQRAHCVKSVRQLRELMGDLLTDAFYADLERDQAERATMSMLVPPQMMNTMVPATDSPMPTAGAEFTTAFLADPVRRYMLPVFSDRRTDWPSHPYATRDSLHEHDMWVTEGMTHRYPTKVLAELLPTCPQYCGHCTRMDLVGNSTPQFTKLKLAGKPVERHAAMLDYLQRTPTVRDVVVSGGDVANMPWKNLEGFLDKLLEIETVRDIRLATKALMGLPQHWLADDVVEGAGRGPGRPRDARCRRARRPQPGRAHAGHQRLPRAAARPVLRAAGPRLDHALLLLHVRHDPVQRALAGLPRAGPAAAALDHGLPARLRHAADRV